MAVSSRHELDRDGVRSCRVCGSILLAEHLEATPSGVRCLFCGAALQIEDAGPSPTASDVGETLRQARLARHETLTDASRWTCLQSRYLVALEGNHTVDEFPGRVYARYFLREYAEHLELDPEPLLRSFDAEEGPVILVPDLHRSLLRSQPRWRLAAIVSLVLLAVIASTSPAWRLPGDGPGAHPRAALSVPSGALGHAHRTNHIVAPTPTFLRAVLELDAPCWVAVTVDGHELPPHTYPPGRILRYHAERTIAFWLGNGGGARLSVDGKRVSTGAAGQPLHLSFAWKDGRAQRT
jgi:hypothetical protein